MLCMQPELRRILYPIFIHTFLDLMQKTATAEAMQLMNRFKRRFREDAAFPSKIRKQVGSAYAPLGCPICPDVQSKCGSQSRQASTSLFS